MAREHPFSLHRMLPVALVAALAVVAFLALRGPSWYRRMYYPLQYQAEIRAAATKAHVDPYLVAAMIHAESGFDPSRVSDAGAVGLMQVMPETAQDMRALIGRKAKVTAVQLKDPSLNVAVGTTYLGVLLRRYGDTATALAAYNAGAVNAERWARSSGATDVRSAIAFPETRAYVDKVISERAAYARLYPGDLK